MKYKVSSKKLNEKILAVHVKGSIYTGGTSRTLTNQDTGKIVCKSSKSIRTIASHDDYLCCGSYDCTAILIHGEEVLDVIEGPDTEIKCLAFSEDGKYLAMATRGKSVWITRIGKEIEIDKILEDHTQDVKGCIFHDGFLFTYGYDNTIKVYDRFEYDDSWEIVQSIEESNTVWCVVFQDERMLCSTEDGTISSYTMRNGWELEVSRKLSELPIYSMCSIGDKVAYTMNRGSIGVVDSGLNLASCIENIHTDFINCLFYDKHRNRIVGGGDDGLLSVIQL